VSSAIASTIAFGLVLALSPWALVIVLVLLEASRGVALAWSFVFGWAAAILVVGGAVVFGLGAAVSSTETKGNLTLGLEVALGIALLAYGGLRLLRTRRAARGGPPTLEARTPRWIGALERLRPLYAFAFGAFWVNYPFVLLWGGEVIQGSLGHTAEAVLLGSFVVLGSSGIGGVASYATLAPERSRPVVIRFRAWITRNTAAIVTGLALVVGVGLTAKAISGFL